VSKPISTNPKDLVGRLKPMMDLVPPAAKIAIANALKDGAAKYGRYNWRNETIESGVYIAAVQRHLDAWWDGEENAEDSGISHLDHAIAGLAILIDALSIGKVADSRPTKGAASEIVKKLTETAKP
jgi:hypothetical protein